ncbi:MAG: DUF4388 domain-containing protein [Nannocystaceae bacterium]
MSDSPQIHMLHFVHGEYRDREFPLAPDSSHVVGRSNDTDLSLEDDTVSRRHARFYHQRGCLWVADLGSRNGTTVNGALVVRRRLRLGDRVAVGTSLMCVGLADPSRFLADASSASDDGARARSMTGDIEEIHLSVVLQWLATSRKTGVLHVRGTDHGTLHLVGGELYTAKIDRSPGLIAEKALFRILAWERGSFELASAPDEPPHRDISMVLEHILMEAARRQDELTHLRGDSRLPQQRVDVVLPAPKPWRDLKPVALDILQAFLDGSSWPDILDGSEVSDLELTREVLALKRDGMISY